MPIGAHKSDFTLEHRRAGGLQIRCVAGPTRPRASRAHDASAWRLISQLPLNYLSLLEDEGEQGAAALRELLGLYHDEFDAAARRQVEGIRQARQQAGARAACRCRARSPLGAAWRSP